MIFFHVIVELSFSQFPQWNTDQYFVSFVFTIDEMRDAHLVSYGFSIGISFFVSVFSFDFI